MSFTPFDELDAVLQLLLDESRDVLADNFVGMYLHGSLAAGGFNARTSDVDFAVVTQTDVDPGSLPGFEEVSRKVFSLESDWPEKLEGSFLPREAFTRGDGMEAEYPAIRTGKRFGFDSQGIENAIQRHVLRTHGIVLAGPDPGSFIAPVSEQELKAETLRILYGWWAPQLTDSYRLRSRIYQAYAVQTMCRVLYTLSTGAVASKPLAAQWTKLNVDQRWWPLIDRAIEWGPSDGVDDHAETLAFISYVLENTC